MTEGEERGRDERSARFASVLSVLPAMALVALALHEAVEAVHGSSSYVALGSAPRSMAGLVGVGLFGLFTPLLAVRLLASPRPLRAPVACLLASAPFLLALGTSRLLAMAPRRASPEISTSYAEALSLAFDSVPRHAVLSVGSASTLACLFALAFASLLARLPEVRTRTSRRARALAWLGALALVLASLGLPYAKASRELGAFGASAAPSLVPGPASLSLLVLALAVLVPSLVVLLTDREDAGLELRRALLASLVFASPTALATGVEHLLAGMPLAPSEPAVRAADLVLLFEILPGLGLALGATALVLVLGGIRRHGLRFTDLAWLAPIAAFAVLAALSLREGLGGWTFFADR